MACRAKSFILLSSYWNRPTNVSYPGYPLRKTPSRDRRELACSFTIISASSRRSTSSRELKSRRSTIRLASRSRSSRHKGTPRLLAHKSKQALVSGPARGESGLFRAQPAELRMSGKFPRDRSEIRHQLFNVPADQLLSQAFNRLANQMVAQAEGKHDTGAENLLAEVEQRRSKPCSRGNRTSRVCSEVMRCWVISIAARLICRLPAPVARLQKHRI
jgi:hypothetical protein